MFRKISLIVIFLSFVILSVYLVKHFLKLKDKSKEQTELKEESNTSQKIIKEENGEQQVKDIQGIRVETNSVSFIDKKEYFWPGEDSNVVPADIAVNKDIIQKEAQLKEKPHTAPQKPQQGQDKEQEQEAQQIQNVKSKKPIVSFADKGKDIWLGEELPREETFTPKK